MEENPWISDLHWVRNSQQSRSQRTQGALLDAAAELFAEKGIEATTVADIAARANSSVGAVYHNFRDKRSLLRTLLQRWSEELEANTNEAVHPSRWEHAKIPDILRAYLEFSIEAARTLPSFERIGLEASAGDPELRGLLVRVYALLDEGLTDLLLARRSEIGHPKPRAAIEFVLDQLGSALQLRRDPSLTLRTRCFDRPDRVFVAEALRSACSYLQIDGDTR